MLAGDNKGRFVAGTITTDGASIIGSTGIYEPSGANVDTIAV